MKKSKINFVIGITFGFLLLSSTVVFTKEQNEGQKESIDFISMANNILSNMSSNVNEKSKIVKQTLDSGNVKDSYQAEAEITAIIAGYREQIESLAAPEKCEEFKKIIVKLMNLMGQMHLALSKGDIGQYKLLAPQVAEYSSKMQKEIQLLQAYYKN